MAPPAIASLIMDSKVADNDESQQSLLSTKSAVAALDCDVAHGGSSELAEVDDSNSDLDVTSNSSEDAPSPVHVGDEVVVREGPLAGKTGTVVEDLDGRGKTIQVALSDGTVDWFGRTPSHASDDSDGSHGSGSDGMSETKKDVVDGKPEPGSGHASELESVSESEFEQACHDAWNASQQTMQVTATSGADKKESPAHDGNHKDDGVAKDGSGLLEPPLKRARAEVLAAEKLGNEGGESGPRLSLGAVGA